MIHIKVSLYFIALGVILLATPFILYGRGDADSHTNMINNLPFHKYKEVNWIVGCGIGLIILGLTTCSGGR